MRCSVDCSGSLYKVQAYFRLQNEQYATWHVLRAFACQGDAFLFRDIINATREGRESIERYVKTYVQNTVVVEMKHGKTLPILKLAKI